MDESTPQCQQVSMRSTPKITHRATGRQRGLAILSAIFATMVKVFHAQYAKDKASYYN